MRSISRLPLAPLLTLFVPALAASATGTKVTVPGDANSITDALARYDSPKIHLTSSYTPYLDPPRPTAWRPASPSGST